MENQYTNTQQMTGVNFIGLYTLIEREVGRFLNVYSQTIVAPVVTTMMFYAVFSLSFGNLNKSINGVSYMEFIAPGLIMMSMVQNSFANTSSSLVISKIQGNIVDILMPPLSPAEIYTGYICGSILRGITVGICSILFLSLFITIHIASLFHIFAFSVLGTMMLGSLGLAAGIWSDKFDHIAAVTNFVVTPMTFLSGTFYSTEMLPDFWREISHMNPFFFMIDGFRYGFIGVSDSNLTIGMSVLLIVNVFLAALSYKMLRSGYKIKS